MKICFLAPANSIHSLKWVKYFADNGHETHWITMYPLKFDLPKEVNFYKIKQYSNFIVNCIYTYFKVKKLIKSIRPDILHIHSLGLYGLAAFSGFHPFVATGWGDDVLFAKDSFIKKRFVQSIMNKADCITCDAEHMKKAMINLGAVPDKVHIINFGIDTKRFYPSEADPALKKKLGIVGHPTVFSLRDLYPIYDIESLLEAAPITLKHVPNARFLIAGSGPEEKKLKELTKSLGIRENVNFLGRIENTELPNYLTTVDVYVSTSLSDAGISASTAEAMSCETPVVITDSGENGKWISSGKNGYLVPVKSPSDLAEKLITLLSNDKLRREIGKEGRKVIKERNDYYEEMKKMKGLYEDTMRNAKTAHI